MPRIQPITEAVTMITSMILNKGFDLMKGVICDPFIYIFVSCVQDETLDYEVWGIYHIIYQVNGRPCSSYVKSDRFSVSRWMNVRL